MVGCVSIVYYVGQVFKGKVVEEEVFVMKIFSNGFVVLVLCFGIDGLIWLRDFVELELESEFDVENWILMMSGSRDLKIELFQKVKVRVQDEKDEKMGKRGVKMMFISVQRMWIMGF